MTKYIKDGEIRSFEIKREKVCATLLIGGVWVCHPTIEQIEADGWRKYIPQIPPTPEPILPSIEELVEGKVRERYTINQEFQVNRKRDTDKEAFAAYYEYVEECIAWAEQQPHREEEENEPA